MAVIMLCLFLTVLYVDLQCVNVAFPGRTHLKLTLSVQFLKVVQQEQQNVL